MVNTVTIPDNVILDKIRKNNLQGWELLYDQYASSMLSIIYQLTGDKEKGEDLLIDLFTSAKFRNFVLSINTKLGFNLCTFVFSYTIKNMREQGKELDKGTISGLPQILQFLYNKNKADNNSGDNWQPKNPGYKSVYVYKWLPVFGLNIYG